ncbi:MAG: leucine-rich repeat domain-containing protein [Lachnospiraceae bacterium]|nr:leucine-rich repeat domain-containing protein [Lachnospiraceae bacterium]
MKKGFHIQDGILISYTEREDVVVVPHGVHSIGEEAFKACISLKKVVLPWGLHRIMARAFKGCRKLEEVEIPAGVCEIGDYAFHRCHSLKKIILPPSVEELGNCVFLYCDSLEEVRLPGVRRLGKQVFVNDVQLKKLEISRQLQEDCICDVFTGCGNLREISFPDGECCVIPNAVEAVAGNLPVPGLVRTIAVDILRMMELDGRCLVKFLTNLKHVEILEGIEKIGKSCFFDKRGIVSVKLPKSLKDIESRAFRNCIGLETVIFQGEQVKLHQNAFKNCSALKQVQTQDGRWYRLEGITGLHESGIPDLVQAIYKQVLGNFRISGTILLNYLGEESRVVVPEGITIIAEEAFAGNEAIDRVILPESLQEIGAEAFKDCLLLQTIPLPQGIRRIGKGAFENCVKLIRAILPQKLVNIEAGVFKNCRVLKEVSLGEGVEAIGEQAFYGCHSLKEIVFPHSLKVIKEMAFYRCSGLKEVRLPEQLVQADSLAFAQSGVRKAYVFGSGRGYGKGIFSQCSRLKTLVLGDNVRHIPDKFAYHCMSLKQVIFPPFLESVGRNVWEKTLFLEDLLLQGQEEQQEILWDGRNLEGEVKLAETVRILAGGAFYGNTKLTCVHIPESVEWIGAAAFKGCRRLRRVYWPKRIKELQTEVFSGCGELEEVETAAKWKTIGERAFYGCKKLQRICWEQVLFLAKEAFCGCKSLERNPVRKELWIGDRALEDTLFLEDRTDGLVIVGSVIVAAEYCSGETYLPEGITGIAPFAFSRNCQVTRVVLPESLSQIGQGAFWGCSQLKEVQFPKRCCRIEDRAFEKCTSLKTIQVKAEYIGAAAFAYCIALNSVQLRGIKVLEERMFEGCRGLQTLVCQGVEEIRAWCFCGCQNLESFDFRDVHSIEKYAFEGCNSLKQVKFQENCCCMPHAFEDCGRLMEVVLSGGRVRLSLREYAFSGCTALQKVCVQEEEWEWSTYQDILSEDLPEIVRIIFASAVSCFNIEQEEILRGYRGTGKFLKIPLGIRRIEAEVFRNVLMLEEVEIPKSVEYIGARAFHGTAWIERQRQASPMVVVNHMLLDGSGCTGEMVVGKEISMVCGWAFANGMDIEKIRFLSDRVKVEEYAFRNCIYLKELILADGTLIKFTGIRDRKRELPPIAKQAVMDSLHCFKTDENDVLIECTGNIAQLQIAEGITAIGDNVFQDGNLLTEVTLPLSVKTIGKRAFAGCKWLKAVHQAQGVELIGDMAFSGCSRLERVELSERLQGIGMKTFENCTSLEEILIPEGMEEIPEKAFYRCHSLQQVQIPSTVKHIGKEAFAFCGKLNGKQK